MYSQTEHVLVHEHPRAIPSTHLAEMVARPFVRTHTLIQSTPSHARAHSAYPVEMVARPYASASSCASARC